MMKLQNSVQGRLASVISSIFLCAAFAFPGVAAADPLADALDAGDLTWTTGGNTEWQAETSMTHDGVDAAKSGAITHSQASELSTTVTGPGTLSFWRKVSSESDYDYLRFSIDGVEQSGIISGTVDWTQKSYDLSAGPHALKWSYTKGNSGSFGDDCGWVDQVVFVSTTPAPEIAVKHPAGTNLVDGRAITAFGSTGVGSTLVKTFTIRNESPSRNTVAMAAQNHGRRLDKTSRNL